jgi:hypothetical protein
MACGRAPHTWPVIACSLLVGAAVLVGAAQPWTGASNASVVRTGGRAFEIEVAETGVDVGDSSIAGVAEWRGEVVAVTTAGAVVRTSDARAWVTGSAVFAGAGPRCTGAAVGGLAARDDLLVAVGHRYLPPEPGDEYCGTAPMAWRSRDAQTWEALAPAALSDQDSIDVVTTDANGFVAYGSPPFVARDNQDDEEDELGRGVAVWRSDDGLAWEAVLADGLSQPTRYKYQSIKSVAARAGQTLAVMSTECVGCYDDDTLGAFRADDAGRWSEVEPSGLRGLDQANSDLIPVVAAAETGYLAFASVGAEHSDDRAPATWFSTDGERWDEVELEGPSPSGGSMDAATSTSHGVIALDSVRGELVVWRVAPRS